MSAARAELERSIRTGRAQSDARGRGLCGHTHLFQGPRAVSKAPSSEGLRARQTHSRQPLSALQGGTQKRRRSGRWGRGGWRLGGRRDRDAGEGEAVNARPSSPLSHTPPPSQETRVEQLPHATMAPGGGPRAPALEVASLPCLVASATMPSPGSSRAAQHPLRVARSPRVIHALALPDLSSLPSGTAILRPTPSRDPAPCHILLRKLHLLKCHRGPASPTTYAAAGVCVSLQPTRT